MKAGIPWLKIVLLIGVHDMDAIRIPHGAQAPLAPNTKLVTPPAAHADSSREKHDGDARNVNTHAIDVDAANADVGKSDVIGPPIYFADVLLDVTNAKNDGSNITDVIAAKNDADENDDADDEIDSDWPLFVRGADNESDRELRLYVDDGDAMRAAGIFGGSGGGFAPTVSGGMVDLMRHREPIETVDFYVL